MAETGYLLTVAALLVIGCYPVLIKKVIGRLGEFLVMFFTQTILALSMLALSLLMLSFEMPKDFTSAVILVMSLLFVVGLYLFYRCIRLGKLSSVLVATASFSLSSAVLSWAIFGVRSELVNYVAIAVIVIGLLLAMSKKFRIIKKLDYNHIEAFFKENVDMTNIIAMISGILFAMYRLAFFFTVGDIGVHRTIAYSSVIVSVFLLFPFLTKSLKELVPKPKKEEWKWFGTGTGCFVVGVVAAFFAFTELRMAEFFTVFVVLPLVTFVLSGVLLKERYKVWQYIGFVLSIIGSVMIFL